MDFCSLLIYKILCCSSFNFKVSFCIKPHFLFHSGQMLKDYMPDVVFSAHSHLSRLRGPSMSTPSTFFDVLGPMPLSLRDHSRTTNYEDGWPHPPNVHEIEVPTCSYRMGVTNMGYGYALVGKYL